MQTVLRVLSMIIGVLFLGQAIQWIVWPDVIAANLGMEVLTGAAASTQIGDIGAFFFCVAAMIGLGLRRGESQWLLGSALLLGSAAVMRTLAWVAGHADFAGGLIGPEVILATILTLAARSRADEVSASAG